MCVRSDDAECDLIESVSGLKISDQIPADPPGVFVEVATRPGSRRDRSLGLRRRIIRTGLHDALQIDFAAGQQRDEADHAFEGSEQGDCVIPIGARGDHCGAAGRSQLFVVHGRNDDHRTRLDAASAATQSQASGGVAAHRTEDCLVDPFA